MKIKSIKNKIYFLLNKINLLILWWWMTIQNFRNIIFLEKYKNTDNLLTENYKKQKLVFPMNWIILRHSFFLIADIIY